MEYTDSELKRLQEVLYDILEEIIRVCKVCHIPYFIQGGSAIGAFFEQSILPWDDDIDVGFTRENYNRFLAEAPKVLREDFVLQCPFTDPHTPYYFAKVLKRGTMFMDGDFRKIPMMRGIYIDVFPFDKVPDNQFLQKMHRTLCRFLNCCFMGKEVWLWTHFRKPDIREPHKDRNAIATFLNYIVDLLVPKMVIYKMLSATQAMFNGWNAKYYNMVLMPRDHISVESIEKPQTVPFGRHGAGTIRP